MSDAIAGDLGLDSAKSGLFLSCAFAGLLGQHFAHRTRGGSLGGFAICWQPAPRSWLADSNPRFRGSRVGQACLGRRSGRLGTGVLDALSDAAGLRRLSENPATTANLLHAFYPIGMALVVVTVLLLTWIGMGLAQHLPALIAANVPYAILFLLIRCRRTATKVRCACPAGLVIRKRAFLFLVAAVFLAGVTEMGPSLWLPAYVEQAAAAARSTSALGMVAPGRMMAVGRLGNSHLAPRESEKSARACRRGRSRPLVSSWRPCRRPAGFTMAAWRCFGLGVSGCGRRSVGGG